MQPHQIKAGPILRVMTYNIHSCVGMDKKVNPERIARVIGAPTPDIVALQEVDKGMPQTHFLSLIPTWAFIGWNVAGKYVP